MTASERSEQVVNDWVPGWMRKADLAMRAGDGQWVKLSEHLTRQSAEATRGRLRRLLASQQQQAEFEIWVTVEPDWISPELYERGNRAWLAAAEAGASRLKSRRPAAVLGRWKDGRRTPESAAQRVGGVRGGLATAEKGAGAAPGVPESSTGGSSGV